MILAWPNPMSIVKNFETRFNSFVPAIEHKSSCLYNCGWTDEVRVFLGYHGA
jgi:hypothetical protein